MYHKLEITNEKGVGYNVKHISIQLQHGVLLRHKYLCKYVGICICHFIFLGLCIYIIIVQL